MIPNAENLLTEVDLEVAGESITESYDGEGDEEDGERFILHKRTDGGDERFFDGGFSSWFMGYSPQEVEVTNEIDDDDRETEGPDTGREGSGGGSTNTSTHQSCDIQAGKQLGTLLV